MLPLNRDVPNKSFGPSLGLLILIKTVIWHDGILCSEDVSLCFLGYINSQSQSEASSVSDDLWLCTDTGYRDSLTLLTSYSWN